MKKTFCAAALCAALVLSGCGVQQRVSVSDIPAETMPAETLPAATIAPDGDPRDVTCLGSYTGTGDSAAIIARMEGAALTNEELQLWYWAEVNQYRSSGHTPAPDFDRSLDTQRCPLDDTIGSWQQYFLRAALDRWHTANALVLHSRENPLPTEDAYTGDPETLAEYMDQMPAAKLLYGYDPWYRPNSQHQAHLDQLAQQFQGKALEAVRTLNYAYMYFTDLTYGLPAPAAAAPTAAEPLVSFRHILLLPQQDPSQPDPLEAAHALLNQWRETPDAHSFAQLACLHSQDPASSQWGGLYQNLRREQLPQFLAQWCFDPARQEGDTTILSDSSGIHILYFLRKTDAAAEEAARRDQALAQQALLAQLRELYPVAVDYRDIRLSDTGPAQSLSQLLYPDIAHQRFPEVPLYLQQDYFGTMYGQFKLTTNGCGITSLAMLASYMTDDELTPPELSARFGRYSRPTGTAGSLFEDAPPQLGFYLLDKCYDWRAAREYMQEGYPVIVVQHKGYWTSGGHYLVLEKLTEDGMVQVRDSNLYNYRKLVRHKEDKFPWETLQSGGKCYWIYEKKATAFPACTRCGSPESLEAAMVRDYLCPKCQSALIRRNAYLAVP